MARNIILVQVAATRTNLGEPGLTKQVYSGGGGGSGPSTTAVAADIATLVADGATPTQDHVNTLNTDWTAYLATVAAALGDLSINYDAAKITTVSQLRAALNHAMVLATGSRLNP